VRWMATIVLCLCMFSCKKGQRTREGFDVPLGSARLQNDQAVRVSERGTWAVVYEVPPDGIAIGGGIAFHVSPWWGWIEPQTRWPNRPGYTSFQSSRRGVSFDLVDGGHLFYVVGRVKGNMLQEGDEVHITYGDTSGGRYPEARGRADRYAEEREEFFLKVDLDGKGQYVPLAEQPGIRILPGLIAQLSIAVSPLVPLGDRPMVKMASLDHMDNFCSDGVGTVHLQIEPEGRKKTFPLREGISQIHWDPIPEGIYRFTGQLESDNLEQDIPIVGTSEWFVVKEWPHEYHLFCGDLHGHSSFSDGTGSVHDYYHYARHVSGMDVAALTDHDALGMIPMNEAMWEETMKVTKAIHDPGSFVTFLGYEWTHWTYGHSLVLFPGDQGSCWSSLSKDSDEPRKLWAYARDEGAICIPHHLGGGPVPFQVEFIDEEVTPVVEISSIHGVSDRRGAPCGIYGASTEDVYYWDVVRAGKQVGVVANGDSHNGHPGRKDPRAIVGGLTVFLAEDLTRDSVWSAIRSRRTCATSGSRGFALLRVNGVWQGGEIMSNEDLLIEMEAFCQSERFQVSLLLDGYVVQSFEGQGHHFMKTLRGSVKIPDGSCLSLHIIGEDHDQIWTSPIWFSIDDMHAIQG